MGSRSESGTITAVRPSSAIHPMTSWHTAAASSAAGTPMIRGGVPSRMDEGSVTELPDALRTRVASSIIGAGVR